MISCSTLAKARFVSLRCRRYQYSNAGLETARRIPLLVASMTADANVVFVDKISVSDTPDLIIIVLPRQRRLTSVCCRHARA